MTNEVGSIGHIALRVTDLPRAKRFYAEQLGWTLARETDQACFVSIGGIILVLIAGTDQTRAEDRFDPFRVGLDHLALACQRWTFRGSNGDWTPPVCETMVSNTTTNPERTRSRSMIRTKSRGSSTPALADRCVAFRSQSLRINGSSVGMVPGH
jgi:hypothetical protein